MLILRYAKQSGSDGHPFQYCWINDNQFALQWADKGKCSSLASQYACLAVIQLHIFCNIYREDTDYLHGKEMSEIDLMSRMSDDENLDSQRIRRVCPSLTASLMIDMATSI